MKNIPTLSFLLILTASFTFFIADIKAQQTISAASLSGNVEDTNGAAVPAAKIAAKNLETNQIHTIETDAEGRFRFAYLPVGKYEVKVEQNGYQPTIYNFTATVGQALEITLKLNVNAITEQVNVSSDDLAIIETARTQVAETVLPRDVESLPLNGRNFIDLALLIPGVSRTNTGSVQRFAETSAVPGTGISIAGQRNLNNNFVVDGTSANDDAADLTGTFYSQEVIREFQVVTSGAVAEFGRASGGFINILTQSGTNEYRGKIYGFLRSERFDARNPLSATKDSLTQTQYGGTFGGKIIKDRTFLFTNFEQTRRNDSNIITIAPANITAINNRLRQTNYRGSLIQTGLVPGGYDSTNLFGRIDHRLNERNSLAATYSFYKIDAVNARTVGGLNAVSRGTNLDNKDNSLNGSLITTVGARSLNELRFLYRNSLLSAPAIDQIGPAVNISGVANFGVATSSPIARDIDMYQISDGFSTSFGKHSLKFGADMLFNRLDIVFPGATQGVYTFSSLNNFLNGNYSQFQQAFGAPSQLQKNPNFGFFVQDEWKPKQNLTLNFGLRYDLQFLPDPINTDKNNLSPRFGFAYTPFEKSVIRGSFGLFYDRLPLRATSNALQRDGSKYIVAVLTQTAPNAPVFPNILSAQPSILTTKPSITRIDPEIKNSYSEQANLQFERELPWQSSFSIGYLYLRGLNLILSRNINVPVCTAAVNSNLCRPNAAFGNISRYESSGDTYYNGMVLSVNKRMGNLVNMRVSYTLSKTIDDVGNFFFSSPQNNFNLRDDRGLSDNDQRHRLNLSGTLNTPKADKRSLWRQVYGGFQLSYIFTYASRLPFNIQTGNDRNGDTNTNDRPIGVGRNTGRGFDYASLDLRASRRFVFNERLNLEILIEGFNILNRSNFTVPNNIFGTGTTPLATFGRPTAAFDPRQGQVGFRLNF